MIFPQEILPKFIQFTNTNHRLQRGWPAELSFESAKEELANWLVELKGRLAWELPLLCSFSVGKKLGEEIAQAFAKLEEALPSITLENFEESYAPVQHQLLEKLYLASALEQELPRITDIKIVNELLILASAFMDGQIDKNPIGQRLPLLLDWIGRYQTDWRTYLRLFPDQLYRVNHVLACFENMKTGAGGIYIFLEESNNSQDLKGGLNLILNALMIMAPAVETRLLTETERVEFSGDLRLERVWRGASWADWSGTSLASELLMFYQQAQNEIKALLDNTLLPAAILEELLGPMQELSSRLVAAFEHLWHNLSVEDASQAKTTRLEALAELRACRAELTQWQEQIYESSLPYQRFREVAIYQSLVTALDGVLNQIIPDAHIEQLIQAIEQGKAKFQEIIEQAADSFSGDGSEASSYQAKARAQAAAMTSRFNLPMAQGQPELIFDSSFEIVQVGAEDATKDKPEVVVEEVVEVEEPPSQEGLADTDISIETAWDALQGQQEALENLQIYLESGNRFNIYQAFEMFSEPFFKLAELVPAAFKAPTPITDANYSCPYCGESCAQELERCPKCDQAIDAEHRARSSSAIDAELATSSPLLVKLDADTKLSLLGSSIPNSISDRWKDLAKKLGAMAKAAKSQADSLDIEALASKLAKSCTQVSASLVRGERSYIGVREDIIRDFKRLEEVGKASAKRAAQ